MSPLEKEEGGVFQSGIGLRIAAADDAGLTAAADAYSARAPYIWRVNGEKLSAIARAAGAELVGVTYQHGKAGIHRAFLRGRPTQEALDAALAKPEFAAVHQLVVIDGPTATNPKPEVAQPATPATPAPAADAPAGAAGPNAPARLDLATLFTSRGLFGASGRIPVPGSSNAHLFVPAGEAGVAMANLAARMGLETTGITLPIASPADTAAARDVRAPAVLAGASPLAQEAERKLRANDTAAAQAETDLSPGEGELRIVDDAFTRRPAVLTRGDDIGSAAAMDQGFRSGGWKAAVASLIEYRKEQRKTSYYSAFIIATFYADQGDKEEAFRWLDTAYVEHDWLLISLKTNFRLDPIRSDPRFAELVRKVGLPQ